MTSLIDCGGRYYEIPSSEPDCDDLCHGDDESDVSDYDEGEIPFEEIVWIEF